MNHDCAAGAQLAQRVRARHSLMANRVCATDSTVSAECHLLLGKVRATNQLSDDVGGLGIALTGQDHLTTVVIQNSVRSFLTVSGPQLTEVLNDGHEHHATTRTLRSQRW